MRADNFSSSSQQEQRAPRPNGTCITCSEEECYGLIGAGKTQKKQKSESKWIECDMCQSWFHSTCQDLKTSDVVFITKLAVKGVKWFCTGCAQEIQGQPNSTTWRK